MNLQPFYYVGHIKIAKKYIFHNELICLYTIDLQNFRCFHDRDKRAVLNSAFKIWNCIVLWKNAYCCYPWGILHLQKMPQRIIFRSLRPLLCVTIHKFNRQHIFKQWTFISSNWFPIKINLFCNVWRIISLKILSVFPNF